MAVEDDQSLLMEKFLVLKTEKYLTQAQIEEIERYFNDYDEVYEDVETTVEDCKDELVWLSELIEPLYDSHYPDGHSEELSDIVNGR